MKRTVTEADVPLCDYCDELAEVMIQRVVRRHRSFACQAHRERARNAFTPSGYGGHFTDPPLLDRNRPRYEDVDGDDLMALMRSVWRRRKRNARRRARYAAQKEPHAR